MSNGYLAGFRRSIVLAAALLSACLSSPAPESPKFDVTVTPVTRYAEGQVLKLNRLEMKTNKIPGCQVLYDKYDYRSTNAIVKDNVEKVLIRYPARVFGEVRRNIDSDIRRYGMEFSRESNESEETLRQLATELYQKVCEDPEKK